VTIGVLLINIFWLLPLAWLAHFYNYLLPFILVIAYLPLIFIAMKVKAGQPLS